MRPCFLSLQSEREPRQNLLASDVADNTLKALDIVLINGARDAIRSNSLHAEAHTEGVHAGANERL